MLLLDANRDQRVERAETRARPRPASRTRACTPWPDDFLGRWDLDGSGTVEADELPGGMRARSTPSDVRLGFSPRPS